LDRWKVTLMNGFLVLETGEVFPGELSGKNRAGEVVFNTSHNGYEEIATDPSYFSQIVVMTAPMQGNYGSTPSVWESKKVSIHGFICLEIQNSKRESTWVQTLEKANVPIFTGVDTRKLTLKLRSGGTPWGALVHAESVEHAKAIAQPLIEAGKATNGDWVKIVSREKTEVIQGQVKSGPRVAVLDYGCKTNIIRELMARCSEVAVFPCGTNVESIKEWNPHGILLSNGPGDPALVDKQVVANIKSLLGWKPIFGICMGHQLLSIALGAKTFRLKFGHRGGNHPVRDLLLNKVYVTSQNHGYAVDEKTLSAEIKVTHINLNDNTVEGIQVLTKKCFSVQYHPESHPGPRDAAGLFTYFVESLK
jgi:carbamoyl-phosphate synthase small subunit